MRNLLLSLVHFLLVGRPSLVSLLEEFSDSLCGLSAFLIDGLPCLERRVFVFAVFLDKGVFQAVVKIYAVAILSFFLNKQSVTLLLQDERDLLFSLMISPWWLFFLSSVSKLCSAFLEYYSFFLWMLLMRSTADW